MTTTLLARLDSDGDVLLAGPAVRAVRGGSDRVVLLCGPRGTAAAGLLPDVDELLVWHCPWIDPEPRQVDRADLLAVADRIRSLHVDRALVLTSFHQSSLPTALLLRLAGVPWIGAVSEDYPGALLDLRHRLPASTLHEVERSLSLATAAGFPRLADDRLAVRVEPATRGCAVVVHPGASVPARAPSPQWARQLVAALSNRDHEVLVTGSTAETALTEFVADGRATDLGGQTDLPGLARLLSTAGVVVVGNTGPAHLAAAVGTPVVSLFAPVVPAAQWRPWRVPHLLLGDQQAGCLATRARDCPVTGHPCLSGIAIEAAVDAVEQLLAEPVRVAAHLDDRVQVGA